MTAAVTGIRAAILSIMLAVSAPVAGHASSSALSSVEERSTVIHQLRLYEIFEGNKVAFHARFRDHAVRIMRRHDFEILAIWETRNGDKTKLVYLLEWPDEQTMAERWKRFMADQEWSEIKKATAAEHGKLVGAIESYVLNPTDYFPVSGLISQM
jgi:hypothetical protein